MGPGGVCLSALPLTELGIRHVLLQPLGPPRGPGLVERVSFAARRNLHIRVGQYELSDRRVQGKPIHSYKHTHTYIHTVTLIHTYIHKIEALTFPHGKHHHTGGGVHTVAGRHQVGQLQILQQSLRGLCAHLYVCMYVCSIILQLYVYSMCV